MAKPNCFNRPAYKDTVEVQDGWDHVKIRDIHGRVVDTRVPAMKTRPNPMSKQCMQHTSHGAATIYGWDCDGCKHEPEAPRE